MKKQDLEKIFETEQARFIDAWETLLRFPSVSGVAAHTEDCCRCATWLSEWTAEMGFQTELLETGGKPALFAERAGKAGAPTVLVYGHYDVQPVDPVELWQTPPFEPTWRGGRLYARGAQDNKGQLSFVLQALHQLVRNDALNVGVKLLLEGEEECGSEGLIRMLPQWGDRLRADVLMVCDTGTVASGASTIIAGLRGLSHLTAVVRGPDHDLHSGMHGGIAPNPAQGASQLVASLFAVDGSVAVPGFYDRVVEPTAAEHAAAMAVPFDPEQYRQAVGAPPDGGIRGRHPTERLGFMPSLDVNGIHSGYGGEGSKTVLPCEAVIKLSARLVPDQDPAAVVAAIKDHLHAHLPQGMTIEFPEEGAAGPGFRLPIDSPLVSLARQVLSSLFDETPAMLWEGASIPIVVELGRSSGAMPLLVGFGHEEDRIHAPNESFSLEQFRRGFLYAATMFSALGELSSDALRQPAAKGCAAPVAGGRA